MQRAIRLLFSDLVVAVVSRWLNMLFSDVNVEIVETLSNIASETSYRYTGHEKCLYG